MRSLTSSKIILVVFGIMLMLFVAPALTQSAEISKVSSKIEVVKASYKGQEPLHIRFTITNTSDKPINVLKWNTPLEGFTANIFQVKRAGKLVPYIGKLVKRGPPRPEDYVNIAPGKSVSVTVDISEAYETYEMGDYGIEFNSRLFDVGHEAPAKLIAKPFFTPMQIRSNPVTFKLLEKRQRSPITPPSPKTTSAKASVFKNCSQSQQTTLNTADSNARSFSDSSYLLLAGVPIAKRPSCERYTYWFGTYDASRYATVTNHFSKIRDAFANQTVTYNCDCNKNYYAYVWPNSPYEIYLCNDFWTAPTTGTDSKFGTLIHEMSHFNVVAGTDDYIYGQAGSHNLATTNPSNAINNADSHEYFAENTPTRQCDTTPTVSGVDLCQLHSDGWIWRFTGTPCSGNSCPGWQRLDNNPKTIAIAAAGNNLYQLHNDGWIWRFTGTPCSGNSCPGWQRLDNNPKTKAIAAAGSNLYQLHKDGWIWRFTGTPCSGNSCPGWQRLDNNPKTKAIAAGD
jgi:peptidyl-Lys metalloendopeptidase